MSDDNLIRLTPSKKNANNKKKEEPKETTKKSIARTDKKQYEKSSNKREVTSISTQKKKGRYNVFIDGKYAFPVDENILVKRMLRKGMVISKEYQDELEKLDQSYKAYQRALTYLSYSLRSEKEIRDDLGKHDFSEIADSVIEKLKNQRLINDDEYAKAYVRTQANVRRIGPKNIEQELKKKGIGENLIIDSLEEYPVDQQLENAEHLIQKQLKKKNKHSQKELIKKLKMFLMKKGFDGDLINQAVTNTEPSVDADEEYETLKKQGLKAWKRYSRKSQGFELVNKTKSYLFGKGFPSELINQFIEEVEDEEGN